MQIWFFFNAGAGGDGVANLFEQSNNVVSFDATAEDPIDYWRVHRFVNGSPKFYAPIPDVNHCFRSGQHFDQTKNQLAPGYKNCISTKQTCIVTSHDVTLKALSKSDCQNIFCKDQIKVLLTLDNRAQVNLNSATKNLLPNLIDAQSPTVDQTLFDFVLDVEKINSDWQYVYNFSLKAGIDLDYQKYAEYQDILKGNKTYLKNNFQVEEYVSCIANKQITYTLINVWQ
jgi:hypothetical protein